LQSVVGLNDDIKPNLFFLISSAVSSGINAAGILFLEDFILKRWPNIKQSMHVTISKILGMLQFNNVCMIFHLLCLLNQM